MSNDQPAEVTRHGWKTWRNASGKPHRENGPAVEYPNGDKEWFRDGLLHREDGPAVESLNGYKAWHLNGERHRANGPASGKRACDRAR